MKVLFLDWNSYGNEDVADAFKALSAEGLETELIMYPFDNHIERGDEKFEKDFMKSIKETSPDFVMSFNYHPAVSQVCNAAGVKYASWVYDSPAVRLFSFTLPSPCNYVFLFDYQQYAEFARQGIKTVYYLPLAAATDRYDRIKPTEGEARKWGGDISFVGSMYTEGHNYYDQIKEKLSEYSIGYLEGLMKTQMQIDGLDVVEKSIAPRVMQEMVDALLLKPSFDGVETYEYLYGNYVIDRKICALERSEILSMIGKKFAVNLYTMDKSFSAEGVNNRGNIDYYRDMPYVFKTSRINLNITLRSIRTGIPLRAMDILGCGGFLLTNFQEDLLRLFTPGEDFVFYESREDLMDKIEYYLAHEDERRAIAENGHRKVLQGHTYKDRIREIVRIVTGK